MQRCPYCMELTENSEKCPFCGHFSMIGKDDPITGKTLNGRFLVGRPFKQTKDFKYYIGWDNSTQSKVTVCRFSGERFNGVSDKNGTVFTKETAVKRFISYGRSMAACGFCSLLPRTVDIFLNDGDGYIVTVYSEGKSLESILKGGKTLSLDEADKLLGELLKGIKVLHNYRMIAGNISPENLYIKDDGTLYLLGVGAPFYDAVDSPEFKTEALNPVYCAPEVFKSGAKMGAFTDVYSAAALYYRAVTGITPPVSSIRSKGETLIPLHRVKREVSRSFSVAILNALNWQAEKRTKNVSVFLKELGDDEVSRKLSPEIVLADFLGFILKLKKEFKTGFKGIRKAVKGFKIEITEEQKKKLKKAALFSGVGAVSMAAVITVIVLFANGTFKINFTKEVDNTAFVSSDEASSNDSTKTQTVKCPDVTGLKLDDAKKRLEDEGLTVGEITEKQVTSDKVGLVLSQSTEAGEEVKSGKAIKLLVGVKITDQNLKPFPNVMGKELTEAVKALKAAGFTDITVKFSESDSAVGTVIKQSGTAGELYDITETVAIMISGKKTKVYDFCSLTLTKAVTKAEKFSLSFVDEQNKALNISEENYSRYTVVSQSLEADTYGYEGQKLVLTLCLSEEEEDTSSDNVTSDSTSSEDNSSEDTSSNNSSEDSSSTDLSSSDISSSSDTSSTQTSSETLSSSTAE